MYSHSYVTIAEMVSEYHKRVRQYESDWAHQKHILCSVPVKRISVSTVEQTNDERWEPG